MWQSNGHIEALERIKSLLKSEHIAFSDVEAVLRSLSGCVQPTKLTEIYLNALIRGDDQ